MNKSLVEIYESSENQYESFKRKIRQIMWENQIVKEMNHVKENKWIMGVYLKSDSCEGITCTLKNHVRESRLNIKRNV